MHNYTLNKDKSNQFGFNSPNPKDMPPKQSKGVRKLSGNFDQQAEPNELFDKIELRKTGHTRRNKMSVYYERKNPPNLGFIDAK